MTTGRAIWLTLIVLIVAAAIVFVVPNNSVQTALFQRTWQPVQGLDLRGGLRVLLEADVPAETAVTPEQMEAARVIVERRVNGLGLTEPLVSVQGNRRIAVEIPGVTDSQAAIQTLRQTGLLEFVIVPPGQEAPPDGTTIQTYCPVPSVVDCGNPQHQPPPAETVTDPNAGQTYVTLMTGAAVTRAEAGVVNTRIGINFTLSPQGSTIFSAHTAANVGNQVAIVLDKVIISAPRIDSAIIEGRGTITGQFNEVSANALALQLRYGSLPVPLRVIQSQEVGATLGDESVRQSTLAGVIGLSAVVLFMILYYRLPGIVAALALSIYAVITFALFVLIPITLTLPGIAGFILSVGVAVDANILIFERMKEELRGGRPLREAVDTGFSRAWLSIRDSNVSTLITCTILYFFGSAFGASIVQGFAITLALGVVVSLFTAILVTRTLLHTLLDNIDFSQRHAWFGI